MTKDQDLMLKYSSLLENLLLRLKNEIDLSTAGIDQVSTLADLDNYLYEINAFYYQSFAAQFMPLYRQQIQQAVADELHVSRTENMIKKDVMAIIKRYAGLYNQVKTISTRLGSLSREISRRRSGLDYHQQVVAVQIGEMLEQLRESLHRLRESVQPALAISQDSAYAAALASSSLSREVYRVLAGLDSGNLHIARETSQLVQAIKLFLLAAGEFTQLTAVAEGFSLLQQMAAQLNKLDSLSAPSLHALCQDRLSPFIRCNLQLIELYLQSTHLEKAAAAANDLHHWLAPLEIVFERKQFLQTDTMFPSLPVEAQSIAELDQKLSQSIQSTDALMAEVSSPPGADLGEVLNRIASTVQNDYPYYYQWSSQAGTILPAFPHLNRVCLDLFLLAAKLEAVRDQQEACRLLAAHYQEMYDWVDKYLHLLHNISADLERLLAPRNLTRIWKGMDIRVEHVVLEEGRPFPTAYLHLLDKHQVEVRLSDSDATILQAEGDIFIIRVDDLLEEEMPYLATSMKG